MAEERMDDPGFTRTLRCHLDTITIREKLSTLQLPMNNDETGEERKEVHLIAKKKGKCPDLENQVFEDLENLSIKSCTIFKVNVWQRESNPDAYTPKMVSIGPYHYKNPQLGRMEKYKQLYLRRFLQRKEGLNEESCINELEKLKEKALKCYEYTEAPWGDFCQMLLLDGCFVVEFIREHCGVCPKGEDRIINTNFGYIFRDLMLLENQLPLFVLNKLHLMTANQDDELPLAILVSDSIPFFVDLPKVTLESFREIAGCNINHLLHLVHVLACHGNSKQKKPNDELPYHVVMPNATELSEAGVSFVKEDKLGDKTSLFDSIKFDNGLMTLPGFRVEDGMETLLRNLIAYEQQSCDVYHTYFSDFAIFMDHLIDSDKDVTLLRQTGIIENWIGEDKQVANLFNKIGKGVTTYSNFYYKEEFSKASQHCKKRWNKIKANLKHNYFSNPWVGASTVAAIVLLILTFTQTILAFTGPIKK